jgi:AmmeMemoRadiSam system protein B
MLTQAMLSASFAESPGHLRAIVVPHAGYRHCIQTSVHAFAQVKPDLYDRVFVLGPSHRISIECCTIAEADRAETPFGEIPFDMPVVHGLVDRFPDLFAKLDAETAAIEHSLEMEFPLLKFVFKEKAFRMAPIMVGRIGFDKCREVAAALSPFADERTLFVISSDFCHWGTASITRTSRMCPVKCTRRLKGSTDWRQKRYQPATRRLSSSISMRHGTQYAAGGRSSS